MPLASQGPPRQKPGDHGTGQRGGHQREASGNAPAAPASRQPRAHPAASVNATRKVARAYRRITGAPRHTPTLSRTLAGKAPSYVLPGLRPAEEENEREQLQKHRGNQLGNGGCSRQCATGRSFMTLRSASIGVPALSICSPRKVRRRRFDQPSARESMLRSTSVTR